MDISTLKDKLDDATFTQLKTHIEDLTGQRDTARSESITGRKGLKEKLTALETAQAKLLEKLGLESIDEIDNLPDARGAAEAAKQYETKLKRLERELATEREQREAASKQIRDSQKRAAIAEAIGKHEFLARDLVETFVSNRLTWEGDELLFKADDGKLVAVKDGVAGLAAARPELLKPTGTGGAGVRATNAGSVGAGTKNPWAKDSFNLTEQVRLTRENPQVAAQMRAVAGTN